jgi:hypothetical protein
MKTNITSPVEIIKGKRALANHEAEAAVLSKSLPLVDWPDAAFYANGCVVKRQCPVH